MYYYFPLNIFLVIEKNQRSIFCVSQITKDICPTQIIISVQLSPLIFVRPELFSVLHTVRLYATMCTVRQYLVIS